MTPTQKLIAELRVLARERNARTVSCGTPSQVEYFAEWRAADMLEAQAGEIVEMKGALRKLRGYDIDEVSKNCVSREAALRATKPATLTTGEPT